MLNECETPRRPLGSACSGQSAVGETKPVFGSKASLFRQAPACQHGVVLLISLIVLVALTMAGLALVRSVDTTGIIAGNLAFRQAVVRAADAATEEAASFLTTQGGEALWNNGSANGYTASIADNPANAAAWETLWRTTISPSPPSLPVSAKTCADRACYLPTDPIGNTVAYTIQRMCVQAGNPQFDATGCIRATRKMAGAGEDLQSGKKQLSQITQYYYRVTTRVVGPRNTTSFVQTIIAR